MATGVERAPDVELLKLIQGVVDRLAANSFLLKGWTVTLVAGLTAFSRADADRAFALIAVFVVLTLGALDAYYLALERRYRALYRRAAVGGPDRDAWSLDAGAPSLPDVAAALRSPAVLAPHGVALAVAVAVAVLGG